MSGSITGRALKPVPFQYHVQAPDLATPGSNDSGRWLAGTHITAYGNGTFPHVLLLFCLATPINTVIDTEPHYRPGMEIPDQGRSNNLFGKFRKQGQEI
ncbi:hypothetical protein [Aquitalea sp.]|uniref:hypothetical protein n=1 Tax=Aquitalea sp. TaxID=1872623 RepID=UPI00258E8D20|nr:hypothetical protein [Aquitalea sp.]